jgi:hypothetical protein
LPHDGVLVDVGSAQGYFAVRAAKTWRDLHVVSLEEDAAAVAHQRDLINLMDLPNIRVVHDRFDGTNLHAWGIGVDCTLLLSVLHSLDDPEEAVRNIAGRSSTILVEHPDVMDFEACNPVGRAHIGDILAFLMRLDIGDVEVIGRAKRHTSPFDSWMLRVAVG